MKPAQSVNVPQDIERGRVHPGHDVLQEVQSGLRGTPSKVGTKVSTVPQTFVSQHAPKSLRSTLIVVKRGLLRLLSNPTDMRAPPPPGGDAVSSAARDVEKGGLARPPPPPLTRHAARSAT